MKKLGFFESQGNQKYKIKTNFFGFYGDEYLNKFLKRQLLPMNFYILNIFVGISKI
jgi:hypothetical protein